MKKLFIALLIAFPFILQSQNYIACGEESGFWNYDTVFVHCDVLVPDGSRLEIAAGTKVIFAGHHSLHVQGSLKAFGQAADTIYFSVADTAGFSDINSNAGGWNGIRLEATPETNDSSLFNYCKFSFGKAVGDSLNCFGGAIRIRNFGKLKISHSHFYHNYAFHRGGGLFAYKSNFLIVNSLFSYNYAGDDSYDFGYGGGLCVASCDPVLKKNEFYGNRSTGVGGAASFELSKPVMLDCYIHDNYSAIGAGLCFLRSTPDQPIANLLIVNNKAMYFGGGIANIGATTAMANVTLAYNFASMGGGYYCGQSSHTKFFNGIMWGNTSDTPKGTQVWIWDVYSKPGFYHCILEGGLEMFGGSEFSGEYEAIFDSDPLFAAPDDFSLLPGSTAINNGTNQIGIFELPTQDFAGNNRLMYGTIDIGAFEYQGFTDLLTAEEETFSMRLNPNPANENSVLTLFCRNEKTSKIRIYSIGGRLMAQTEYSTQKGINHIRLSELLPPHFAAEGLFLLEVVCGNSQRQSLKFIR